MVASRYKYFITIGELRALCKTDILGTNLAGMAGAVSKIGFKAVALQGEAKDTTLNAKLLFPCIAHVKIS
jgi:ABC-type bacteriocin/lantibiotic exporter with double-glycine peptidase domain